MDWSFGGACILASTSSLSVSAILSWRNVLDTNSKSLRLAGGSRYLLVQGYGAASSLNALFLSFGKLADMTPSGVLSEDELAHSG